MNYYITDIDRSGSIAVDDNILVKGVKATAGSKMLENFTPLFSAEAVEKLVNAGYKISGKTSVGEFGLDLLGETSYFGATEEDGHLAGAAAALIKKGDVKAALNVDMNGVPRRAAAVEGTDFIKPTYGTVSRYGVVACACSGEAIGVSAGNAEDIKEILTVIAGHDSKDGTSLAQEKYEYSTDKPVKGMKIALVKELYAMASDEVKADVDSYAAALRDMGAEVEEISLENLEEIRTAWQILLAAETCNNLSRFDGVKYGYRAEKYSNIDELYVNSRSESMQFMTKATVIYGSDALSKNKYNSCYDKSLRIRRVAMGRLKKLFENFDAVLAPACSKKEYKKYDIFNTFSKVYDESIFTAPASITGFPAVVTKGVQLIGDAFTESKLLSIASGVEKREA